MKTAPDLLRAVGSLFYPPTCEGCGTSVGTDEYLCEECRSRAPRIVAPFCTKCCEPFSGAITGPFACSNCADQTLHFEAAVAGYRARGIVRRLIHEFKYQNRFYLRHVIGEWIDAVNEQGVFLNGLTGSGWKIERPFQRMRFGHAIGQSAHLPFAVAGPEFG